MNLRQTRWLILSLCIFWAGCGFFDSAVEWRHGPYVLMWIDDPDEVTLSYELGKNSSTPIISACVFAVGQNERYLVAKQHPGGDKNITNFFIVDAQKNGPHVDFKRAVIGPLSAAEFMSKSKELNLPPFTKELTSLR